MGDQFLPTKWVYLAESSLEKTYILFRSVTCRASALANQRRLAPFYYMQKYICCRGPLGQSGEPRDQKMGDARGHSNFWQLTLAEMVTGTFTGSESPRTGSRMKHQSPRIVEAHMTLDYKGLPDWTTDGHGYGRARLRMGRTAVMFCGRHSHSRTEQQWKTCSSSYEWS